MAMKNKMLSFYEKGMFFVGANHDNEGKLGIVTCSDHCPHDKEARKRTDEMLKNDKGLKLLQAIGKQQTYSPGKGDNPLKSKAFQATTDIWSILFHYHLIEVLRENGWTVIAYPPNLEITEDLTENAMQI